MKKLLPKSRIINKPGHYIITHDIEITNELFGVQIRSDSVTLDFQDHRLFTLNHQVLENFGVYVANVKNVKILSGKIEGFYYGLMGGEVSNIVVHNMHFDNIKYIAINISGSRACIHDNLITNLDFHFKKNTTDYYLIGINISASHSQICKNIIKHLSIPNIDINSHLEYVGILIANSTKGNLITCNQLINNATNRIKIYGVWCGLNAEVSIANNYFTNNMYDVAALQATVNVTNNKTYNSTEFSNTTEFNNIADFQQTLKLLDKDMHELRNTIF